MADQDSKKDEDKDKGAAGLGGSSQDTKSNVPTLKDFQKTRVKIKSMGARSFLERIKAFKKKDLAFILAGLGVLFLAPLAEHFLFGPEKGNGISEGWDFRNGPGSFGSGGSPYEPGVNGLSPGEAAGGNGDIITPLNVRDPSSLIMGPGGAEQPPVGAPPAETEKKNEDYKNAFADAGRHAASHAALPMAPVVLSEGALRGFVPGGGGTSASYTLPKVSAENVPNTAAPNKSLDNVKGNIKSANSPIGYGTQDGGSSDALRRAAAEAGSFFNRPGSAGANLQNAANVGLPTGNGNGGAGQGNGGGSDKAPGQDQNKDGKSAGESLAYLAAKENQEKAIDLYWKKVEQQEMMWPKIEEATLTSLASSITSDLYNNTLGTLITSLGGNSPTTYGCYKDASGDPLKGYPNGKQVSNVTPSSDKSKVPAGTSLCFDSGNDGQICGITTTQQSGGKSSSICDCTFYPGGERPSGEGGEVIYKECELSSGGGSTTDKNNPGATNQPATCDDDGTGLGCDADDIRTSFVGLKDVCSLQPPTNNPNNPNDPKTQLAENVRTSANDVANAIYQLMGTNPCQ